MKTQTIRIIALALLLTILNTSQNLSVAQDRPFQNDYKLDNFTVKIHNQVAYLNFHMKETSKEFAYVIQRSNDQQNYETIYTTNGYLSPNGITLMYCHRDNITVTGKIYYRLLRVKKCDEDQEGALICDFDQNIKDTFVKEITVNMEENGSYTLVNNKQ